MTVIDLDQWDGNFVRVHNRLYCISATKWQAHPQVKDTLAVNVTLSLVDEPPCPFVHVETTTDGRTVWVNTEHGCVARFCPFSGEVHSAANSRNRFHHELPARTYADWYKWKRLVLLIHGIEVDMNPLDYLKE